MTDPAVETRAARPTILVGYGAFGLEVLRRLLQSAALRGILSWEGPRAGAAASERSLRDLALLWVPDRLRAAGQQVDKKDAREGSSFEMMRDLYWQIQQVEEQGTPESDFAAAVSAAAEKLLSASARAGRRGILPLGLDVVVLARPTAPEVVGSLDRMLVRGMDELANNANLERGVLGSEALTFIGILDFENYGDRGEGGKAVRQAVHNAVDRWCKRRQEGKPAFSRFYLVDGRTEGAIREEPHRLDEITLFLELLLFEGQRSGELQRMYRAQNVAESPLATFGVRLMERSAGLLSRLAAARFAIGWLAYAAGTVAGHGDGGRLAIHQRLGAYRPSELERHVRRSDYTHRIGEELDRLEKELLALPTGLADWPQQARDRYQAAVRRIEAQLGSAVRTQMEDIARQVLAPMPADLRAAVDEALNDPREAASLGTVIAEIDDLLAELSTETEVPTPRPGASEAHWQRLDQLHLDYRRFHRERVDVVGLRRWWWLLAAALAAGLTPLLTELLGDVPQPAPTSFLLSKAYDLLQKLANPLVVGTLSFVLLGGLGAAFLQRRIAARLERARRFYLDSERGRFVDRLRDGLLPGGALRAPLDDALDRLLLDMTQSVRGEISRELGRIVGHLRERRREMLWLREQLREFLRLYGLEERGAALDRALRNGTGIRHSVERVEDFERMLGRNPPVVERFRSLPAAKLAAGSWQERHNAAFLQPIAFLDRLSELYEDPLLQELARAGAGPEQQRRAAELVDFLSLHPGSILAFWWKDQEGVFPARRYCLLPPVWRTLPGVLTALSDVGIATEMVLPGIDGARAYLLSLQTGVDVGCLLE